MADEKKCPHCGKPVPPTALGDLCPECMLKAGLATQTEGPGGTGPHGTKVVRPPPSPAEIATLFPQLEILECLGRGGMGVVYKARQPRLNRFVALKILAREKEQDAQFAERFTREAQALARLNHPNIVTVHDFGEAGGHCYLVMEFVDGLNLRQLLQTRKMPSDQALTIVPKICEALQYAHEQGVVHRDIKPENILLDKSGRVKIADFGIAKMLGDEPGQQTLTGDKDAVGTPHYMAPEQIEKPLSVDHRADIYSLGVVFYEMLTGELPLGRFAPPSKKVQIDVRLDEVVLHALEKEPERRYQQASQVKTAVETIAATATGGSPLNQNAPAQTAAEIETARRRLKIPARGLIAAAVLQLLFALGLLVFAIPAITSEGGDLVGYVAISFGACLFAMLGAIVLLGAVFMMKLRNFPFSVAACVVGAVAGPGAILGLPFGVWACVELFRPEVRAAFAADRSATRLTARPDSGKMDFARAQARGPAIGLVVTGVLDWVLMVVVCIFISLGIALESPGSINMFVWLPLLAMALSGCIIYAGLKFMQLERRGWVMFGSVLALLVSPGNLIGLPLGIWALVTLNRREVRAAFEANQQDRKLTRRQRVLFGPAWRFAAFVFALILSYELSKTVFSHWIAGHSHSIKSDYIGQTWFPQGDSIEITSVERTPERMVVKGSYNLVSHDEAALALYVTVTNKTAPGGSGEERPISKGHGDFTLLHLSPVLGLPHVSMSGADGHCFASLYFGTKTEALAERKASWITNVSPLPPRTGPPENPEENVIGSLNLIVSAAVNNLAIARTESVIGFPWHEVVARFAGPALTPEQWQLAHSIAGPTLAPSPYEKLGGEWEPEPVNSTSSWEGMETNKPSACWFACPNECDLQFALPDEADAKEAAVQMRAGLSKPLPLHFGERFPLFQVGEYEAWLEVRKPQFPARKLSFINTDTLYANGAPVAGRSPVQPVGSNPVYSAAITIPSEATMVFTGVISTNNGSNVFYDMGVFSTTLTNQLAEPGLYWLTWRPGSPNSATGWEIFIHDAQTMRELGHYVSHQPMKFNWRADWSYQSSTAGPGEAMRKVLLINDGMLKPGNQPFPNAILSITMNMQPLSEVSAGWISNVPSASSPANVEPQDLREARAKLAELRVDYTEQSQNVQAALARIKALEENEADWMTNAASASTLQFRLVLPDNSTEPADWLPAASGHNRFFLSRQILLDDSAIARAGVDFNRFGRRVIEIHLTDAGAKQFEAITATNIGHQLAIVFRGQVLCAPVIQTVIPDGECQVDGAMNTDEINEIVDCLNHTATPTIGTCKFSSVHDRILPLEPPPKALFGWLNLESGMVLTNSTLDWESRSGSGWIRNHGLDLVTTDSAKHFLVLLGFDMVIAPAPTNGWNIATAADVVHNWAFLQNEPQQKQVLGVLPGQTDTFFFETREGGKGVLQILGFADNPPGVRLRYKLVQATAPDAAIDPATGLPNVRGSAAIDPNTGLPIAAPSMAGHEIDSTTGLPITRTRPDLPQEIRDRNLHVQAGNR